MASFIGRWLKCDDGEWRISVGGSIIDVGDQIQATNSKGVTTYGIVTKVVARGNKSSLCEFQKQRVEEYESEKVCLICHKDGGKLYKDPEDGKFKHLFCLKEMR